MENTEDVLLSTDPADVMIMGNGDEDWAQNEHCFNTAVSFATDELQVWSLDMVNRDKGSCHVHLVQVLNDSIEYLPLHY